MYDPTLSDYRRLRVLAGMRRRFSVIGVGIGSEIAPALSLNGQEVFMIFPDRKI